MESKLFAHKSILKVETDFIIKLMHRTHIMKFYQLQECLEKKFNLSNSESKYLIYNAQLNNYLIVSVDGYVFTNGYYRSNVDDRFGDNLKLNDSEARLPFPIGPLISKKDKNLIKSYDVVCKMMPYSEDFYLSNLPFEITFCIEDIEIEDSKIESAVYQIMVLNKENSTVRLALLNQCGKVEDDAFKRVIKRIAIIEDKDDLYRIPEDLGFSKIVMLNDGKVNILKVNDNPWNLKK